MTLLDDRPRPRPLPRPTTGPTGSATGPQQHRPRPRPTPRPVPYTAAPRPVTPPLKATRSLGWLLAILVGQAFMLAAVPVPVVRPVVGLLLIAGIPILTLCRRPLAAIRDPLMAFLYSCGATILAIIVVALLMNTVLPWVGIDRPLARPEIVVASTVIDLLLVGRRSSTRLVPRGAVRAGLAAALRARFEPAVTVAVIGIVLSVAGAVRLNNGYSGDVATIAHVVAIAALGVALLRRGGTARNATVVYLSAGALLLGTSLRGWFITGHDIQNEYLSYLYTHNAQHWVMSTYPTPYNACLSINILPATLVEYLGVTGVFVFKVAMQLVFALVPVCVYVSARRMVSARMALLSATLFVFFPTFFTDMPFLVRQEVAYLFVVLALLAATQATWSVWTRRGVTFAFGAGVVASHYSTTYVLIVTLLLGLAGVGAGTTLTTWRERREQRQADRADRAAVGSHRSARRTTALVMLAPLVVGALAATAWLWSSPATHSGGHLADTVSNLTESIIQGNFEAGSSDLQYSPFGGGGPTDQQRFDDYIKAASDVRKQTYQGQYLFANPTGQIEKPALVTRPYVPLTPAGKALDDVHVSPKFVNGALRAVGAAGFQIFLVVGLLALVFRSRNTRNVSRERFWLMMASVAALGSVVIVPGLSADYGVLRAFQQTLLFAAPLLAVGVMTLLGKLGRRAFPVAVALTLGIGVVLTGAAPAALGGYYAQLSQSNSGQYYNLLYVSPQEISATKWLAATAGADGLTSVTGSDIVSVTRLQQYMPKSVAVDGDFLPLQLHQGGYVFMAPQTVEHGQATIFYTGNLISYRYPVKAVGQTLDLVYSTTGTRIYR